MKSPGVRIDGSLQDPILQCNQDVAKGRPSESRPHSLRPAQLDSVARRLIIPEMMITAEQSTVITNSETPEIQKAR